MSDQDQVHPHRQFYTDKTIVALSQNLVDHFHIEEIGALLKLRYIPRYLGHRGTWLTNEWGQWSTQEIQERQNAWIASTPCDDWEAIRRFFVRHIQMHGMGEMDTSIDVDSLVARLYQRGGIKLLLDRGFITQGQFIAIAEWVRVYTEMRNSKVRRPRAGFVYVLKGERGLYKIGRTIDYTSRRKTFGVKLPMEVSYELVIRSGDYVETERDLHLRFEAKRDAGEWFYLTQEDIDQLRLDYSSSLV